MLLLTVHGKGWTTATMVKGQQEIAGTGRAQGQPKEWWSTARKKPRPYFSLHKAVTLHHLAMIQQQQQQIKRQAWRSSSKQKPGQEDDSPDAVVCRRRLIWAFEQRWGTAAFFFLWDTGPCELMFWLCSAAAFNSLPFPFSRFPSAKSRKGPFCLKHSTHKLFHFAIFFPQQKKDFFS